MAPFWDTHEVIRIFEANAEAPGVAVGIRRVVLTLDDMVNLVSRLRIVNRILQLREGFRAVEIIGGSPAGIRRAMRFLRSPAGSP